MKLFLKADSISRAQCCREVYGLREEKNVPSCFTEYFMVSEEFPHSSFPLDPLQSPERPTGTDHLTHLADEGSGGEAVQPRYSQPGSCQSQVSGSPAQAHSFSLGSL